MKITKALMVEHGLPWHIENGTFTPSEADVQYAIHNGVARQLGSADHFSYGTALELLVLGAKVQRAGWESNGMWLAYMSGMKLPAYSNSSAKVKVNDRTKDKVNDRTKDLVGADTAVTLAPYISMWTAQGTLQPGWLPSQADQFAADWRLDESQVEGKQFYLIDLGANALSINA